MNRPCPGTDFRLPVTPRRGVRVGAALGLLVALVAVGCGSDGPVVDPTVDGVGHFDGSVDPDGGAFSLNATTVPGPGGTRVELALIGRNLHVETGPDGASTVIVDVSVRNRGDVPLYQPAELAISRLDAQIWMPGADWAACPRCLPDAVCGCTFGFSYADRLGDDGVLSPGEESLPRSWRFQMPHASSFSFAVDARFGFEPNRPHLAGLTFMDPNENGRLDSDESPAGGFTLEVSGPGLDRVVVAGGDNGAWSLPVTAAGIYTILATPPPTFAPVHFTTPNPLQVILSPGPGGAPESFDHADFGIANDLPGLPRVVLFDGDPADLKQDPYSLAGATLNHAVLSIDVGYSGCQPGHPLGLVMVGGFMESNPVQARLVVTHDGLGELCDAAFSRSLSFDLSPIREAYRKAYGRSGPVILNLAAPNGQTHHFELAAE